MTFIKLMQTNRQTNIKHRWLKHKMEWEEFLSHSNRLFSLRIPIVQIKSENNVKTNFFFSCWWRGIRCYWQGNLLQSYLQTVRANKEKKCKSSLFNVLIFALIYVFAIAGITARPNWMKFLREPMRIPRVTKAKESKFLF